MNKYVYICRCSFVHISIYTCTHIRVYIHVSTYIITHVQNLSKHIYLHTYRNIYTEAYTSVLKKNTIHTNIPGPKTATPRP